ncbi:hypothetical protein Tco_1515279 [Tanacetum coccineum]
MWVIRIKHYFQIQDYTLWEVIENGNSWVSVPQTSQENGTLVTKMLVPVTVKEKTNKKNDVKARSLLLMALPNEHQVTFSQYTDAKTIASSSESLDSIFNRLQKIQDLEQIHEDDLEAMDLKCSSLAKYEAKRYFQRTGAPRNKEGQFKNQDNTRKQGNNEDTSSKAMLAINGCRFDWSNRQRTVQTNIDINAFSESKGKPQQDSSHDLLTVDAQGT